MSKILFIGAGKMATAIAGGIVRAKVFAAKDLVAFDVSADACENFTSVTGIKAFAHDVVAVVQSAQVVLLAVKPQVLATALQPLEGILRDKPIISIVAGVTLEKLAALTESKRIVRVMPNTPALVGCGAAGFATSPDAKKSDIALAEKILSAVGVAMMLPERNLDAVTALSGSGPAYVFEFIQALADGGVAEGLPRDVALKLAVQTVMGSAKMVAETKLHPSELADMVTSPAGTTSRAMETLADYKFHAAVMKAVRAAADRSCELGK